MRQTFKGVYGKTQTLEVTDTAQILEDVATLDFGDYPPIGLLLTCESNDIRYAFRVNPTASFGHVLKKDIPVEFFGPLAAKMRVINDTAQSDGVLMITPIYEPGKYS